MVSGTSVRWSCIGLIGIALLLAATNCSKAQAPAPAAPAVAAPAAAAPAQSAAPESGFLKNLWWIMHTSGAIGAFLLLLSIFFMTTVAKLFTTMKMELAVPPAIVSQVSGLVDKRDFKGLFSLVKEDNSELSQLMRVGLAELGNGLPEARAAMERNAEAINSDHETKISMLAVLGTLGPMIGLLGTLKGMIASFSVIATSDTQLKASEVAEGISEALLLTFEGVLLSVPAIFLHAMFRNRIAKMMNAALLTADEYVGKVAATAKAKPAAPAAAPATKPAAPPTASK